MSEQQQPGTALPRFAPLLRQVAGTEVGLCSAQCPHLRHLGARAWCESPVLGSEKRLVAPGQGCLPWTIHRVAELERLLRTRVDLSE